MKSGSYDSSTPIEGKDVNSTNQLKPGAKEAAVYQGGSNTQDRWKGTGKVSYGKGGAKGFSTGK